MPTRNEPVNRQTLHEEGWSDPVTVVAERYGLSDAGLAKVRKRLQIPVPGRGYRAKVKAGKIMHKVPLPALTTRVSVASGPKPQSDDQRQARATVRRSVSDSA